MKPLLLLLLLASTTVSATPSELKPTFTIVQPRREEVRSEQNLPGTQQLPVRDQSDQAFECKGERLAHLRVGELIYLNYY